MVDITQTVVFTIYMFGVLGIGIYASQYISDTPNSFYLADKGLGTVVLAFTLMATVLSSLTFFGLGGQARTTGLGQAAVFVINVLFWAPLFAGFGSKVKRVGDKFDYVTPPEYLRSRFNHEGVPAVYLLISTLGLIGLATTQIIGGGVALNVLMGIPYVYGIVGIAGFMAIYIHISGMLGVAWTDTVQGVMMFISLLGAFFVVLVTIGPVELVNGVQNVNPSLFTFEGPVGVWTPLFVITFGLAFPLAFMSFPQVYQRFLAADSVRTVKNSALIIPILGLLISLSGIAIGVWSVTIVPNIDNPDHTVPLVISEVTSPIVTAIVLSAAVAALMSTTDAVLLSLSSMISRDLYRKHINPSASKEEEVRVTHWVLLALIIFALLLAYVRPGTIFQLGALAVVMHGPLLPALYLSLYWDGATAEGSIAAMLLGEIIILGYFLNLIPSQYEFGLYYGFLGLAISFIAFFAVSVLTSTSAKDIAEKILYT